MFSVGLCDVQSCRRAYSMSPMLKPMAAVANQGRIIFVVFVVIDGNPTIIDINGDAECSLLVKDQSGHSTMECHQLAQSLASVTVHNQPDIIEAID